jgi:hypothetical protein
MYTYTALVVLSYRFVSPSRSATVSDIEILFRCVQNNANSQVVISNRSPNTTYNTVYQTSYWTDFKFQESRSIRITRLALCFLEPCGSQIH